MSMLVRFAPQDLGTDVYDKVTAKLEEGGDFPPDGLEYHVCFKVDGQLAVSEIWESQEKFDKFGERLMPVLEEAGVDPGEPTILEVHNQIKP